MRLPDMQELVHSARAVLPSGRIEEMCFVRPSDAERLLKECRRQAVEIKRLQHLVQDAYIEGHADGGQCWSERWKPGTGYTEADWLDSDARKAAEVAEREE
jgi:hypothetical protein